MRSERLLAQRPSSLERMGNMELHLEDPERRLLQEILEERYSNLIHEIARTDHREFKRELQDRCLLIERILKKVRELRPAAA